MRKCVCLSQIKVWGLRSLARSEVKVKRSTKRGVFKPLLWDPQSFHAFELFKS